MNLSDSMHATTRLPSSWALITHNSHRQLAPIGHCREHAKQTDLLLHPSETPRTAASEPPPAPESRWLYRRRLHAWCRKPRPRRMAGAGLAQHCRDLRSIFIQACDARVTRSIARAHTRTMTAPCGIPISLNSEWLTAREGLPTSGQGERRTQRVHVAHSHHGGQRARSGTIRPC